MAHRIAFHPLPRDSREALRARLDRAPEEHARAVLAAFDLLQQLHERGLLDIARSALAASDELLAQAVEGVNTPEATRALRNVLLFGGILGRVEPARDERVSLWTVIRHAMRKDTLRGLLAALDILDTFGRSLPSSATLKERIPPK
jgi:hypothetical protein